ncbi:MAG: DUF885 family protein [Chthonomonadales bacterium]
MTRTASIFALALIGTLAPCLAQTQKTETNLRMNIDPRDRQLEEKTSEMRGPIERFSADLGAIERTYHEELSSVRRKHLRDYYSAWQTELEARDFGKLSHPAQVDFLLLKNHLRTALKQMDIHEKQFAEAAPFLPFMEKIAAYEESRHRLDTIDPPNIADEIMALKKQLEATRKKLEAELVTVAGKTTNLPSKAIANRAVRLAGRLQGLFNRWFGFYNGYDPLFTWWVSEPHKVFDADLTSYITFLKEKVVGIKPGDDSTIVGDPIGRDALLSALEDEMIPYTPEELVEIANKEMAWCEKEMRKASNEMGFGDDWHKALEKVKTLHVEPGKQPELIKRLALEAIEFVEKRDLVTIPPLAKDTWRMSMMSAEAQMVNPFFLGGEQIQVSFPTNTMPQDKKLMSLRGNNIHFAHATVQHELIPGHHLQGFMQERYRTYRAPFSTPFWIEGWALYWELILFDKGFADTPESRVGMLFWRMHRCARIIFSLQFHLGKMTPEQCVDYLVERVGHERENAAGEVRRSFLGTYSPLYQAAYLLGGLQIRSLRHELVDSGKMKERDFHDAILKENSMPIEIVRASLTGAKLTKDWKAVWRFYDNQ